MELTGVAWDINDGGADAVLKPRALDKSGDFEEYWDFHMQKAKAERYWEYWELAA